MLLDKIVSLYKSEDDESALHSIDLIVPLTYASRPDRLMVGTRESLLVAMRYKQRFPRAVLAFGNPAHLGHAHSAEREYALKQILLGDTQHVCGAPCTNSVTEAETVREVLDFVPARILVICGESHSRAARLIWQMVFPESTVLIRCIPFALEYQSDHPFAIERRPWPWFLATLARHALILTLGLRARSLTHRAPTPD